MAEQDSFSVGMKQLCNFKMPKFEIVRLAGSEKLCADFVFDFFAYCGFEAHLKSQFRSALNFNAACISVS